MHRSPRSVPRWSSTNDSRCKRYRPRCVVRAVTLDPIERLEQEQPTKVRGPSSVSNRLIIRVEAIMMMTFPPKEQ